ncbi:adenosylcobinamide-GDP ribazoletransferase [Calditerrivibrio nitroreducens]|uniref:Adenosylcobinamide-GDP ribazoletransferase n=1 Tax=Calditerrivibrio nitroreducens (strain DSM 19672 / NBRC 101217 / Yu37-1) TaxID=768670 RepID=E4TGZ4_CALNY|nr:adenosylcobinamide-GDP ribazoletransferase [Calditerrivibrio nitroreducens]ADR19792.1 cobalamin 5'-phosphate synthase [Calditerrivibrio nitroreducens DSM 19672]
MKGFLTAVSFLTILKIDLKDYDNKKAVYFFPMVGLLIALPAYLLLKSNLHFKEFFTLLYLTIITGALHLDGLADTADAFFSHKEREKKLQIMKDSRIGVMGAVTLILASLFKYELLKDIHPSILFFVLSYSRLGAVIVMLTLPYARESGTGSFFKMVELKSIYSFFLLIPLTIFLYQGLLFSTLFNTVFILLCIILISFYKKIIGGWTGDMVGAFIEFSEIIMLYISIELKTYC